MKHRILFALCWVMFGLATMTAAHAATYYVATTGNDTNPGTQAQPFKTIQKGLNTAANGDTVQVAAGMYAEPIIWENKSLTLQGAGEGQSIIDGGGAVRCLDVNNVPATARLGGFTIRNGRDNSGPGGMSNTRSHLTVSNCTFSGNTSIGGGGMYNFESNPIVTNCTFSNNSGGGMFNYSSSPTVTHCVFTGNIAYGTGGGMGNRANSYPIVTHCTFTGNSAVGEDRGGGGGILNEAGSYLTATHCTFTGNSISGSAIGGGGIRIDGYGSTAGASITDCIFIGNSADGANAGGGIDNYYGFATVTRCTFKNNRCPLGAGMSCWVSSVMVINCTFTDNSSTFCGGMDIANNGATVTNCTFSGNGGSALVTRASNLNMKITNCILRASTAAIVRNFGDSPTVTYSNVQGGYPGIGNIDADPKFINPAGGNYHLQPDSPCLNTGSASAPNLPSTDLDGGPRILGSAPDMGAYECWDASYGLWFVDKVLGNDTTGNGSPAAPFATVTKTINVASSGHKIYIKQSNYGTDIPRITKTLRLFNWGNTGLSRVGQP